MSNIFRGTPLPPTPAAPAPAPIILPGVTKIRQCRLDNTTWGPGRAANKIRRRLGTTRAGRLPRNAAEVLGLDISAAEPACVQCARRGSDPRCTRAGPGNCYSRWPAAPGAAAAWSRLGRDVFEVRQVRKMGTAMWGVFVRAGRAVAVNQYVGEYLGDVVPYEYRRAPPSNYYMTVGNKHCTIDAHNLGNYTRFFNHSCNPNVVAINSVL